VAASHQRPAAALTCTPADEDRELHAFLTDVLRQELATDRAFADTVTSLMIESLEESVRDLQSQLAEATKDGEPDDVAAGDETADAASAAGAAEADAPDSSTWTQWPTDEWGHVTARTTKASWMSRRRSAQSE
jgi:Fic family protein